MRGKNKYIVPLLLAGLTTASGIVTTVNQQQQTIVHAETTSEVTDIASLEMRMKKGFKADGYSVETPITMPTVEVEGGSPSSYVYTIKKGSKVIKEITIDTTAAGFTTLENALNNNDNKFTPSITGAYDVTIEAKQDGKVVSKIDNLKIKVNKAEASIVLPVNSKYVIPAQLPVGHDSFKIPQPTVVTTNDEGEDEEVTDGTLSVYLVNSKGEGGDTALTLSTDDDGVKYYAISSEQLENAGTYQIRYVYTKDDTTITSLNTNFQVVKDLDPSDIDLRMKLSSSIPSTGNVNTDIEIPKVTVLENKNATDGINAHITVTYRYRKGEKNSDGNWVYSNNWTEGGEITDYEKYTFRPTEVGLYELYYTADLDELYGDDVESIEYRATTKIEVTDKKAPTVRPTDEYVVETDGTVKTSGTTGSSVVITSENSEEVLADTSYNVPSVVYLTGGEVEITLPAIYGDDNYSSYNKIHFTREIAGNGVSGFSTQSYKSFGDVNSEYYREANKSFKVKLTKAGNYEIRYKADDIFNGEEKQGNTAKAVYTLVVKDSKEDIKDSNFAIKMNVNRSTIADNDTLSFVKPTASDTYDSSLEVVTYYDLWTSKPSDVTSSNGTGDGDRTGTDGLITDSKTILTDLTNGKYSIKCSSLNASATYIRIVTVATRDYSYNEGDNVIYTEKWVAIKNGNDEVNAVFGLVDTTSTTTTSYANVNAENWNKELLKLNSSIALKSIAGVDANVSSIDDNGYAKGTCEGHVGSDGILEINTNKLAAFNQGKENIVLPAVTFKDADEDLSITVVIKDNNGDAVNKVNYGSIRRNGELYTVSGVSFKLSTAGMYTVTYRAEDIGGNVTIKTFGIRVNDTTEPVIKIENTDSFGTTIELGDTFEVPTGVLYKNNEYLTGEYDHVEWDVDCDNRTTNSFTPEKEGTYKVVYYGVDSMGNSTELESESFWVKVEDTTAPEIDGADAYHNTEVQAWKKDEKTGATEEEKTYLDQMTIDIPQLTTATDPNTNDTLDVEITVTGPDGTVTLEKDDDGNYYFIAKKQGKYTVSYIADDTRGNTAEKTIEYSLGDCEKPTLKWKDGYSVPTTIDLNGNFELSISNMILDDNETESENLKLTAKLIKPDGSTEATYNGEAGETYNWDLTETGTYSLQITVTDEANNSQTYKYSIEVPSEDADSSTISPVVGTILIVVSVVILAGVVIYFVVSSRKKVPAKAKASRSKKK